jgi:hypothetical protein
LRKLIALAVTVTAVAYPDSVQADDAAALGVLLPKLAAKAERFEALLKKASLKVEGYIETVDGDGKGSDRQEGAFRIRTDAKGQHFDVIRYAESGEDKTEEARKEAREREAEKKKRDPDDEVHMPFLVSEQPKYSFRVRGMDKADPARVRIEFVPKHPAKNLAVGSAWVDTRTGEILTMGGSPSKTSMFVDYLRVAMTFGERMGDVYGASKITFEGSGGFLFFHKKYRGMAKLSEYSVPPGD